MIITCKCLNMTVTCGQIDEAAAASTDSKAILDDNSVELQKHRKNVKFYNECVDFFRQAIGPTSEATCTPNQLDLVYNVPLNNWVLNFCINCSKITHAKHATDAVYLINAKLLTSTDEIAQRKADKAYSATFGILMYDHQRMSPSPSPTTEPGMLSFTAPKRYAADDQRLRSLQKAQQDRMQREITATDDRIRRYTEQQFALLKSFRDKSEQEYQILVSLVNQVPENLKQTDAIESSTLTNNTDTNNASAIIPENAPNASTSTLFALLTKQAPSFDTPPATPESTPMSVGNSPTFRQQTSVFGGRFSNGPGGPLAGLNAKAGNDMDECLFELEGFGNSSHSAYNSTFDMSDVEETEDAEDNLSDLNGGIQISRGAMPIRKSVDSIAKSLPIAIAKSFDNKRPTFADSDDELPEDNVDIAASIKALARSVHGDTVFGDLPRPRFSTQI